MYTYICRSTPSSRCAPGLGGVENRQRLRWWAMLSLPRLPGRNVS